MATNYCGSIDEMFDNVTVECPDAGFEAEAVFIKRSDIDWSGVKYDEDNTAIVNAIATKTTKGGAYVYQLKNAFSGTSTTINTENSFRNRVDNTLSLVVFSSDADSAKKLNAMLNGEYVAILRQKYKDVNGLHSPMKGGAEYRIYGLSQGLTCTGMDNADPASDNTWTVTFTETGANSVMYFLACKKTDASTSTEVYDLEATQTMYESFATPSV